jgi:hypothetical protein
MNNGQAILDEPRMGSMAFLAVGSVTGKRSDQYSPTNEYALA